MFRHFYHLKQFKIRKKKRKNGSLHIRANTKRIEVQHICEIPNQSEQKTRRKTRRKTRKKTRKKEDIQDCIKKRQIKSKNKN
jgi:hypothetical protein